MAETSILKQVLLEEFERNNHFIESAEKEVSQLPIGYISKKSINNKTYFYYQWREGDKIRSKYIKMKDVQILNKKIRRRKELEEAIRKAKNENRRIERALK
ncbi:MAG TPA: hypothetical protein PLS96_08590 [Myxococcota bacterium]|nr:hypothetical protein [Myxococcota bacterium]HPL25526.1 hypothetical protein [Myxococcota bacterium]HQE74024.1 hypothetical protein [Myxococcota bacterium]HQI62412.1 hypothetical protein [Myxococcota bacterium]